jgi:hypothetical protein
VHVIFDGAGTQAAADLAKTEHKYHELFEQIRGRVTGVCSYCAGAYGVKERIEASGSRRAACRSRISSRGIRASSSSPTPGSKS